MRSAVRPLVALAVAVFLCGAIPAAIGQSPGTAVIEGRSEDSAGAVMPGVAITVTCDGKPSGSAVTRADGSFRIEGLRPGVCDLRAVLMGFKPFVQQLTLVSGKVTDVKAVLAVGGLTETVTVSGMAPSVQSTRSLSAIAGPPPPSPIRPQPWRWPSAPYRTTSFDKIDESPFLGVVDNPLSTFSVDVDTASYAYMRRALTHGLLPEKDSVRVEELLNYFRYDYPSPRGATPFSVTTEVGPCPWNTAHRLMLVGLQARRPEAGRTPPRNLVFLLDVSGSMGQPDKLPLVQSAMSLLTTTLTPRDRVAIVVYAGSSGVVLPPTAGDQHDRILGAIQGLRAGGSTNGASGIELAYEMAARHFDREGVNRVILATDGDFNTGTTSRGDLLDLIEARRKTGIYLSVLGVGADNLKDGTMEQIADRGNGNYAYLDSLEEAGKVLVREAGATFITVAKDVKIQVEFNPARISAYRLIGYENRALKAEDFKNDKKDAGEIGAGHSVTALYEIVEPTTGGAQGRAVDPLRYQRDRARSSAAASSELAIVKLRYKRPSSDSSVPIDVVVNAENVGDGPSANLGFSAAVAAFGMLLRDSEHKGTATWRMAADLAARHRGSDPDGYRAQFVRLVDLAEGLERASRARQR